MHGQPAFIQYLYDRGVSWHDPNKLAHPFADHHEGLITAWKWSCKALAPAAQRSACLRLLIELGCPCDTTAYIAAIDEANLEDIKCYHSCGVAWDESVSTAAIKQERTYILQYLREHRCPVNFEICTAALHTTVITPNQPPALPRVDSALFGDFSVELFKYAIDCGYPLVADTSAALVQVDNYKALQYVLSKGCPYEVLPAEVLAKAPRCATSIAMHERKVERTAKRKATEQLQPNSVDN